MKRSFVAAAVFSLLAAAVQAEPIVVFAAGSLKAALSDIARHYEQAEGGGITLEFGPSGILRERIEKGATAHLFASANMNHPKALAKAKGGHPVVLFARNRLCALAQPGLAVDEANLLSVLLDPNVRLGTSTPKADPSGDYAWQLFAKAEKLQPGAFDRLSTKALKLTGGADSKAPPPGRHLYGWVMQSRQADIFLTYCTNAVLARREVPNLNIVTVPPELAVGADYGLVVLNAAPQAAWKLALYLLSQPAQERLAHYGFEAVGLQQEP